jgi:hypothetical protein
MEHFYHNLGQNWFTYPNLYSNAVHACEDNSHFVEVGVWKGRSASYMAVEIINSNKNIKFDCVDTWEGSDEHKDPALAAYEPLLDIKDGLYNEFLKNTQPVKHIINPIRLPSLEAANLYEDNTLDFVFIDAAHDYESVKKDITAWFPKIKKGGTIAGHDYSWCEDVRKAVHEFFQEKEIHVREGCWIYFN